MPPCSCTVSDGDLVQGVGAVGPGHRRAPPQDARRLLARLAHVLRRGGRGRPGGRAGRLDEHEQVGHPVLERLERADRPAELHPLLAVGHGHVQAALGRPDLDGRGERPGDVEQRPGVRRPRRSRCPSPETRPSRRVWSREPTTSTVASSSRSRRPSSSRSTSSAVGVEHQVVEGERGDRARADRGQQVVARHLVGVRPGRRRWRSRWPAAVTGRGCGRAPRARSRSRRARRRSRRTPRARAAPPRPPARTSPATAPRRTRPRTPSRRGRPRCRCACRAGRARSSASSSCSSVRAKCIRSPSARQPSAIRARWYDVSPHAPTSARTG